MSKDKCIFFDFDGVIVDSFDAAEKIGENLKIAGSADEYRALFEGSIAKHLNDQIPKSAIKEFFERYAEQMSGMKVVPGIVAAIRDLAVSFTMTIVSSSYTSTIEAFLKKHSLDGCFVGILGFDKGESKSEKIAGLLEERSLSKESCVMVTDTLGDIEEANSVGVQSIGVLWGYHDKKTLQKGSPAALAGSPKKLVELIVRIVQ